MRKFGIPIWLIAVVLLATTFASSANAEVTRDDKSWIARDLGIPVYVWKDSQVEPQSAIIAIQGAVLHGRAYDPIARILAGRGVLVVSSDLRGFGAWYRGSSDFPMDKQIDLPKSEAELRAIYDKIKEVYPHMPIYWMGESFGANTALRMSTEKGGGLILSSYAPKQRIFFEPKMIVDGLLCLVHPSRYFDITNYVAPRLSEDPVIIQEAKDDNFNRYIFTAKELFHMAQFTDRGIKMAGKLDPQTPVLLIHGTKDRLIRASDVQKFYDKLNCKDKKLIMLDKIGHIHIETSHLDPKVVDGISKWASDHVDSYALANESRNTDSYSGGDATKRSINYNVIYQP